MIYVFFVSVVASYHSVFAYTQLGEDLTQVVRNAQMRAKAIRCWEPEVDEPCLASEPWPATDSLCIVTGPVRVSDSAP